MITILKRLSNLLLLLHTPAKHVLSPCSSANYKALLIHIVYILYLNVILSNLSLQRVKVELVFNEGISVVIISVYSYRVLRDKIDSVPINKARNLALRD
jgi:hypothetical protein